MIKKLIASAGALAEHRYFQRLNRCFSYMTHLLGMAFIAILAAFFLPVLAGSRWGSSEHANTLLELLVVFLGMLVIIFALVFVHKQLSQFLDR